MYEIRY